MQVSDPVSNVVDDRSGRLGHKLSILLCEAIVRIFVDEFDHKGEHKPVHNVQEVVALGLDETGGRIGDFVVESLGVEFLHNRHVLLFLFFVLSSDHRVRSIQSPIFAI